MKTRRELLFSLASIPLVPLALRSAPKQPAFELFNIPNTFGIHPRGINNAGAISGWVDLELQANGFIKTGDQIILISVPNSVSTRVWGIDNTGNVAGHYFESEFSQSKGFIYQNGQYTPLNFGIQTQAVGIYDGKAVGFFYDGIYHGFLYENGKMTQLDVPNSTGTIAFGIYGNKIVGRADGPDGQFGFIYENGQYQAIHFPRPGGLTELYGLNRDTIIGAVSTDCLFEPFILTGNRFQLLDIPGTEVFGINDSGIIVGEYGRQNGFIARAANFIQRGK